MGEMGFSAGAAQALKRNEEMTKKYNEFKDAITQILENVVRDSTDACRCKRFNTCYICNVKEMLQYMPLHSIEPERGRPTRG